MPKLKYKCDWSKIQEKARSQHQQEYKIGSVKDAVMEAVTQGLMENPYQKYEQMKADKVNETTLHAAHGTKLQEMGEHVLEFDLAGSGYKHFQSRHAGLDGRDHYYQDGVSIPLEDIDKGEKREVRWWNRLPGFLRAILGAAGESEIRAQNAVLDEFELSERQQKQANTSSFAKVKTGSGAKVNTVAGAKTAGDTVAKANTVVSAKAAGDTAAKNGTEKRSEALIRQKFGVHSELKGLRDKKYIYVKDRTVEKPDHTKTYRMRYSMSGPQSSILGYRKGARNRGEYSIHNVSDYMLTAGKHYLETIFKEWDKEKKSGKKADPTEPITIMVKGHSRGGVSAAHGAMKLKYWLKNYYPRYENKVRFKVLQMDPVAGFGSDHGLKSKINLREEKRPELRQELAERRMATLGDSVDSTVVYSLHTNHRYFFSPQSVDGAKRIILTTTTHGVNLGNVDQSQKAHGDTKAHRQGYLDLSTGEMYRSSGLHELPEGIYIADENNRLIKVPSLEVGRNIVSKVLEHTSGQEQRHERIDEVMKNWFDAHEKVKKVDSVKKERIVLPVKTSAQEEKIYAPEHKNTEKKNTAVKAKS